MMERAMRGMIVGVGIAFTVLSGCGRESNPEAPTGAGVQNIAANVDVPVTATEARTDGGVPGEPKASLPEPRGPIDPASVEAAGQVVQHYGAEIERGRWLKAEKAWGDVQAARAFATALAGQFGQVHLEIGKLGQPEGAAGSIYVTMPVVFYGEDKSAKDIRRPAEITLRRVNDVPGSTDAQRRWHIERIEWTPAKGR
jgi:hypothetical protein